MLTREQLVELERGLRDTWVLSVYLDGAANDFAERSAWRTKLDNSLASIRLSLHDASHAEREAFASASSHVRELLAPVSGALRSSGWIGFVTEERVAYSEGVPVSMPTLVTWEHGIRVAPYLRALKQHRPVIVAVADSHRVRLYRYHVGHLDAIETLHAHAVLGPFDHMGDAPSLGFHAGVRGTTGTDESQRMLREGLRRMLAETSERIVALAGAEAWIVVGGTPQPSQALASLLCRSEGVRPRLATPHLHVWSSEAEIARAAAQSAGELRRERDLSVIASFVEGTPRERFGASGLNETRRALRAGAVRELLVSHRFLDEFASVGERLVRAALEQAADIEEVSGAAGGKLDELYGGVAARLRFAVPESVPAPEGQRTADAEVEMSEKEKRHEPAAAESETANRESGLPGGGTGRTDAVGESGVYPMSGGPTPGGHAEIRDMASWGQGARGAAGYEDAGGSELVWRDGQLLGGFTAGPSGEPTIDIHREIPVKPGTLPELPRASEAPEERERDETSEDD